MKKWIDQAVSVTPKQDITWYVKWTVSIIMLTGMALGRGTGNPDLQIYDIAASWIGALGWYWVGYKWGDRAMQLVNGVMLFICTVGLINQLNLF
jgi:hypothetical protein